MANVNVVGSNIKATRIELNVFLQSYNSKKKKWVTEVSWEQHKDGDYASCNVKYQLYKKGNYRLFVKAVMKNKSGQRTHEKYSAAVKY